MKTPLPLGFDKRHYECHSGNTGNLNVDDAKRTEKLHVITFDHQPNFGRL